MYPIGLEVDFVEDRNRLTTFFRNLMLIPLMIVSIFYAIGGGVAIVLAWFAVVFTGTYPEGLRSFVVRVLGFFARLSGYQYLLTDTYPPFGLDADAAYPVRFVAGPPPEQQSRLTAFFRGLLAIPLWIVGGVVGLVVGLVAFIAWFAIMFTGKMPSGLQEAIGACLAYTTRVNGYYFLLTDEYPPLLEFEPPGSALAAGGATAAVPPPPPPTEPPPPPPPPPSDPPPPSVPGVPSG